MDMYEFGMITIIVFFLFLVILGRLGISQAIELNEIRNSFCENNSPKGTYDRTFVCVMPNGELKEFMCIEKKCYWFTETVKQ